MSEQGWGNGDAMEQAAAEQSAVAGAGEENGSEAVVGQAGEKLCDCPPGECLGETQFFGEDGPSFAFELGSAPFSFAETLGQLVASRRAEAEREIAKEDAKIAVRTLAGAVRDMNYATGVLARLIDETLVNPED